MASHPQPQISEALPPSDPYAPPPRGCEPDTSHMVTEDDTPVDNIFSEKQQRLLTEPLYTSWAGPGDGRPFVALANVGLFYADESYPLVPDMLLSLDVELPADIWKKANRSYVFWKYKKMPEVVVEIVSNRKGHELDKKLERYARMGAPYYVVFDPQHYLSNVPLRIYGLHEGIYVETVERCLKRLGLCLTLWEGEYEGRREIWLRWSNLRGELLATGAERSSQAEQRAETAEQRAGTAEERATRLAARLRELGIDPETF